MVRCEVLRKEFIAIAVMPGVAAMATKLGAGKFPGLKIGACTA